MGLPIVQFIKIIHFMQNLISFDLRADFGFFRKPETNEGLNLSYNMIHKPALLGILGAIIGLDGYKKKGDKPEYLLKLETLKVGIKPLDDENGNFQKTVIKYSNTIGYANKGTTYLTEEATLIKPAYRCYLLLESNNEYHQKLKEYIFNGKAEFIPYFGKNEFSAWWNKESVIEYEFETMKDLQDNIVIDNLFLKSEKKNTNTQPSKPKGGFKSHKNREQLFVFFERLPIDFNEKLLQYNLGNFAYTSFSLLPDDEIENLYLIKNNNTYVQLN